MSNSAPSDLAKRLEAIAEANDDADLVELMRIADGQPGTFWLGANFRGVDLGRVDVAGWCFSGADLRDADLSKVTSITDAVFTNTTLLEGATLPEGVTIEDLQFRQVP